MLNVTREVVQTSGKIHVLFATILGLLVLYKTHLPVEAIFFCTIGGMFPDADAKTSKIGRILPLWLLFKPHRKNLLHSPLGALCVSIPLLFVSYAYALLFFIGYCSHLFLDMFNRRGIPLLYPRKKMFRFAKIRSNGIGEWILLFALFITLSIALSIVS